MELINTAILKNPFNWFIVLLMLLLFAMFADYVARHYGEMNVMARPETA